MPNLVQSDWPFCLESARKIRCRIRSLEQELCYVGCDFRIEIRMSWPQNLRLLFCGFLDSFTLDVCTPHHSLLLLISEHGKRSLFESVWKLKLHLTNLKGNHIFNEKELYSLSNPTPLKKLGGYTFLVNLSVSFLRFGLLLYCFTAGSDVSTGS